MKISGAVGDIGVEGMIENRELMLEMCVQNDVAVCNTFFSKKREPHMKTWVQRREERRIFVQTANGLHLCIFSGESKGSGCDSFRKKGLGRKLGLKF